MVPRQQQPLTHETLSFSQAHPFNARSGGTEISVPPPLFYPRISSAFRCTCCRIAAVSVKGITVKRSGGLTSMG
mgnify:CR=1 FL=1